MFAIAECLEGLGTLRDQFCQPMLGGDELELTPAEAEIYVGCRHSNFLFKASEEALAELVAQSAEALDKLRAEAADE